MLRESCSTIELIGLPQFRNRTEYLLFNKACNLLCEILIVHPAGFEPALPKETDLKSVALDHSAMDPEFVARHHLFDFNKYR